MNENDATFEKELEALLNSHSMENGSDTPDFILAAYLTACLKAFDAGVSRREEWYGRTIGEWRGDAIPLVDEGPYDNVLQDALPILERHEDEHPVYPTIDIVEEKE